MIPTQCPRTVHDAIAAIVTALPPNACVVELGCWLGGLTRTMAEARPDVRIHAFDRFVARGQEPRKALDQGVPLRMGESTLPLAIAALKDLPNVTLHAGDIRQTRWNFNGMGSSMNAESPIHLFVDDACKHPETWAHALKTFQPSWVPGETIIALLDYDWLTANRRYHQFEWTCATKLEALTNAFPFWRWLG